MVVVQARGGANRSARLRQELCIRISNPAPAFVDDVVWLCSCASSRCDVVVVGLDPNNVNRFVRLRD
ncbi:hypothetical protein SESBI_13733 [Sesbania bispinosa]|nr:hypothetical protein SESBI_13733 [Sesbania bispinosa]